MTTLMVPGWTSNNKITCSGETVAASWKKGIGFLSWADEAMRNAPFKNLNYSFNDTGVSLSATLSLPKISVISDPPQKKLKDLRFELNKLTQEMGLKITLTEKEVLIKIPRPANQGSIMRKGPAGDMTMKINTLMFKISSEYNPVIWLNFLTKFSSFEVNNIVYNLKNNSWAYEGVFYVL